MWGAQLREQIVACARQFEADLVCFGGVGRFQGTRVPEILPQTKTVICLAFRVLRGVFRGIEEGTTYYQYCTNGVEVMDETIMPRALLRVCALLEDAGYIALPQRRHHCVMEAAEGHDFEVDYSEIYHGRKTEISMNFEDAAVRCGLGERGFYGSVITPQFGPMQRFCFVLTDAELEESPLYSGGLCDQCRECVRSCPGNAISPDGGCNPWQCGPYYRGARRSKNPFMPPDAFPDLGAREAIMSGDRQLTPDESIQVMAGCIFYPPIKQGYAASICGKACDMACYAHLEQQHKLVRNFQEPFRRRPEWKLNEE